MQHNFRLLQTSTYAREAEKHSVAYISLLELLVTISHWRNDGQDQ
jgi:hypothetical protein